MIENILHGHVKNKQKVRKYAVKIRSLFKEKQEVPNFSHCTIRNGNNQIPLPPKYTTAALEPGS